jgi:hypothetical protein
MKKRRILRTAVLWSGVVAGSAIGAGQSATAGQIGSGIVTQGQIGSGVVADGQIGSGIALLKRQARDLVVVGAIDAVNPAAGTISVLGQTINVADAEQLYSLASNRVPVAVFGKASRDGAVDARAIVVAGREYVDGANTVFLKGRVSSLDLTTGVARIGKQLVDLTPALHQLDLASLKIGAVVELTGTRPVAGGAVRATGVALLGQIGSGSTVDGQIGSGIVTNGQIGSGNTVDGQIGSGLQKSKRGQIGSGIDGQIGSGINGQIGSGIVTNGQIGSGNTVDGQIGSGNTVDGQIGSGASGSAT